MNLIFKKTGKEIKNTLLKKQSELEIRLKKRNTQLDEFLSNPQRIRFFFTGKGDIDNKKDYESERNEIMQLITRVNELETELEKLSLTIEHIAEDEEFEIGYHQLIEYGFNIEN